MAKQLVLMDHDGGVDDYLATMLLMTISNFLVSLSLLLIVMYNLLLALRGKSWI